MTYKYALLKQEDKLVVYLNEEEKPNLMGLNPFGTYDWWQLNHKRIEVHEDYTDAFINFAVENYDHKHKLKTLRQILSQGIVEIPAERIKLKEGYDADTNMYAILLEPVIKDSLISESKEKYCVCYEMDKLHHQGFCGNCGDPVKEESQILNLRNIIIESISKTGVIAVDGNCFKNLIEDISIYINQNYDIKKKRHG